MLSAYTMCCHQFANIAVASVRDVLFAAVLDLLCKAYMQACNEGSFDVHSDSSILCRQELDVILFMLRDRQCTMQQRCCCCKRLPLAILTADIAVIF